MAWTTPRTWVAGEVVTASLLNTHVRDDLNALRDYMLGAQDLGSNWKISSGRSLYFSDPDVAHGMTGLVPTDVWLGITIGNGTGGGTTIFAQNDADTTPPFQVYATSFAAAPAFPAFHFSGAKKNGTVTQALAASEPILDVSNNNTMKARFYGDGGLNIAGAGLAVGYSGAPVSGALTIGDAGFTLQGGTVPLLAYDSGDVLKYTRSSDLFEIQIGSNTRLSLNPGLALGQASANTVDGSILLKEITEPIVANANEGRIFLMDNGSGKTIARVRFQSGASVTFATEP